MLTTEPGFLEALSSDKVAVYPERIQEIVADGFIDAHGHKHEVDVIICATGWVVIQLRIVCLKSSMSNAKTS